MDTSCLIIELIWITHLCLEYVLYEHYVRVWYNLYWRFLWKSSYYLRLKYALYNLGVDMKTTYASLSCVSLRSSLKYVLCNYISIVILRSGLKYVLSNYIFCLGYINSTHEYTLHLGLKYASSNYRFYMNSALVSGIRLVHSIFGFEIRVI